MKSKRATLTTSCLSVATLALALVPTSSAFADSDAGKTIFLAQKCNLCHSLAAEGIDKTTKSEKIAGPDLGGKAKDADPAWLAAYLQKKETREGKAHPKEAKLSESEMKTMVEWLATFE